MRKFEEAIFVLIPAAALFLMYKTYQQSKLQNPDRRGSISFIFQQYYNVFPISYSKAVLPGDKAIIKKANRAVLIFWILFFITIIYSII